MAVAVMVKIGLQSSTCEAHMYSEAHCTCEAHMYSEEDVIMKP